jgi:hypothetical protein
MASDGVGQGSNIRGLLGSTYTDRCVDVEGRYPEAVKWLRTHEESPNLELEKEVLASLKAAPADFLSANFYRGRPLPAKPESSNQFGSPPNEKAPAGRYNAQGTAALYLCSSTDGVRMELEGRPQGTELWIQRYGHLTKLQVADARTFERTSLAGAVFYEIESHRFDAEGKPGHPNVGPSTGRPYCGPVRWLGRARGKRE